MAPSHLGKDSDEAGQVGMGLWESTFPKIPRRATHLINDVSLHVGVVILHVLYTSVQQWLWSWPRRIQETQLLMHIQ